MADFIEGTSEHTMWAPLSSGQTLSVSRHLQEQIRQLQGAIDDMAQKLSHVGDGSQGVKEQLGQTNGVVRDLQASLAAVTTTADATRCDLGRLDSQVQGVRANAVENRAGLDALREAQKMSDTKQQKADRDHDKTKVLVMRLQEAIEKTMTPELAALREKLRKTDLDVDHLRADQAETKQQLHDERAGLREANVVIHGIREDLHKTNDAVDILDGRLAQASTLLNQARQDVADLGTQKARLNEDHEATKGHVAGLQGALKRVTSHVKHVSEDLDKTGKTLLVTRDKVDGLAAMSDGNRQRIDKLNHNLNSLGEGHSRGNDGIKDLLREVEAIRSMATQTRLGLQETNELVLPNLSKSELEASKTPRPKSTMGGAHITKSLGSTAPNRMAWI